MKRISNTKAKQPPKNNLKISQFFKRKTDLPNNSGIRNLVKNICTDPADSEDDFVHIPVMNTSSKINPNKETKTGEYKSDIATADKLKKRKSNEDQVDREYLKKIRCDNVEDKGDFGVDTSLDATNCTILNETTKSITYNYTDNLLSPVLNSSTRKTRSPLTCLQNRKVDTPNSENNKMKSPSPVKTDLERRDIEDPANMTTILNINLDAWEDDSMEETEQCQLDFTEPHHCKIIDVTHSTTKIVLTLASTQSNKKGLCTLEGFWTYTKLAVGDTVYITGKNINNNWVVNNDYGLLVFEPDLLISSTSVVSSLWCKRRSLLSDRFKGFDSSNQYMLVGNLVHSLLQYVLKNNVSDKEKIEEALKNFIAKKRVVKILYESDISLQWIEDEVVKYIPKIQKFMKVYVKTAKNSEPVENQDDWKGTIDTIEDIEENIWSPELGIKGKIDVTVRSNAQLMPLELKTGKASVSIEHRGQVILYLMMMKKVGYGVISGLLLYLKEGVLREISSTHKEERDLVRLRNELVYYLTRPPKIIDAEQITPPELPEPINHRTCKSCPYSAICTVYAHFTNEDISSKTTLKKIQQETLEYLTKSHIDYFMKWTCLLITEAEANVCTKNVKEIYMVTPEEREKTGKCIGNLKIVKITEEADEVYSEHFFEKINNDTSVNFVASGIFQGAYVVVSTSKRHAVASGFVTSITSNSISVSLERNLNKKYQNQTFCVDSFDSNMNQSYNLSSLSLLLDPTPRAASLRKIIIDKEPPTFKRTLPKIIGTKGKSILKRLNIVQQRAVLKAITANEYFLIKGMPGTGKTATIVALIQLLYELDKTVLITSHTNSAVDNVCLKLLQYGVKFMRLGSESRIHKDLVEYSEHNLIKNCTSPEEYATVYNSARILAVTCMSSGHPALIKRTLDICIVDESTQVLQSSVIRPLYSCKTFILIGDPDQLPAVVRSGKARDLGMSESLFERLHTEEAVIALNINYRMNSKITSFANSLTYNGELMVGSESISNATIDLPNIKALEDVYDKNSWILKAIDDSLDNAVQFLDTGPVWNLVQDAEWKLNKNFSRYNSQNDTNSKVNIHEAAVIFNLVEALVKIGVESKDIGVIASYRHQVDQISSILKFDCIDVNTVDQFQGKDKSIIIYSCGNSKDTATFTTPGKEDILEDKRRLTVAITRAKHKLIIVGDVKTLVVYSTFKKLLSSFGDNIIRIYECKDFLWENVLRLNCL